MQTKGEMKIMDLPQVDPSGSVHSLNEGILRASQQSDSLAGQDLQLKLDQVTF